jgi:two-component system NtrC family sensor kinase
MGRIDSLVAQMLRFAAPANPGQNQVALHATIEHTLRMVTPNLKSRSIALHKELAAQPDLITGDDYQLEQAILNLLINAIEAMGAEGTLTIATDNVRAGDPRTAGTEFAAKPCLLLCVSDTGPGIPPESQRHIFEPFFTTKPHGTGLGLAITQRIVREHDGLITLTSAPGQGCTFSLLFPHRPTAG